MRHLLALIVLASCSAPLAAGEVAFTRVALSDQFFSEGADVGDFNHDGVRDVASGPFWYAGPAFTEKHRYYQGDALDPHGYSEHFFTFVSDVNGDGWDDIVVVGFPGHGSRWYENPKGADGDWPVHPVLEGVDGESPLWADLRGDGKRELVCLHGQRIGWAAPDATDPTKPWTFHPCSAQDGRFGGFCHGLGVGDVDGDGKPDLIEARGWWKQPASLDGDPTWEFHPADFGGGGAQMFAYDVDGDGRADVITSLHAHGYGLAWFQQGADGAFTRHLIMAEDPAQAGDAPCFSQLHALALADVDGDGLLDIVTGKRHWAHGDHGDPEPTGPAVCYWFGLKRGGPDGAIFVPHRIDDASGVGTQVVATDVDGDGKPDVVIGNKLGTFVLRQAPAR